MAFGKAVLDLSRFFSEHPLTRGDRAAAWMRFASWQVRSRLSGECEVQWIAGQKMMISRGMTGATGNIYAGLHEFSDMMLLLHVLRPDDLFLDIGANIGSYTVLASGVCGATTWAFEPDPGTAKSLRRNIALNTLEARVVVHEVALGEADGTVQFTTGLDTVNHVVTDATTGGREVPLRRLDSLIGTARPVMIKMDVEGYEEPALRGARAVLETESLKVVEIETISPEIVQCLTDRAFERAYYDPFRRSLTLQPNGLASNNALFVRDWDTVARRVKEAPPVRIFGKSI